jgi:tight adherence protein C
VIQLLLPLGWAALVLEGARRRRPAPARVHHLAPAGESRRRPTLLADARARRWIGAAVVGVAAYAVLPLIAPVAAVIAWGIPVHRARRRASAASAAVRRSLPEAVDLLGLAVGAGLTVPLAVAAVGRRHRGPVGAELARVAAEIDGGRRCADALEDAAARLGADAQPVIGALVASERYGAPLADALARLAGDVRADQRRRAEEAARRVPVKLLFPLVLCVLPAFTLLTVVPLLAGALGSLRL